MKKMFHNDDIFVLSSSCTVTKGANQSVIVDYLRNDIQLISNEYYELIHLLNRNTINGIIEMIDEDSLEHFHSFLNFMLNNEFGMVVSDLNQFPEISTELHDEIVALKDSIVEIDTESFNEDVFKNIIRQIDSLSCDDLQIRFLSEINFDFADYILDIINKFDIFCIEIHSSASAQISQEQWFFLIEKYAALSRIFIYSSEKNEKTDFIKYSKRNVPLLMGNVYYVSSELNSECCGVITQDNLSFGDQGMHNLLKSYNGCLYKKLTIDRFGNIKNCPSMQKNCGNILKQDISSVIKTEEFKKYWIIKKDDIEICKDCEFRYNCTDCRAFLVDPNNIKSKPLKCGYNPYTNVWEENSINPLKNLTNKA